MRVDVRIDHHARFPYAVIHARSVTDEVNQAVRALSANHNEYIMGYAGDRLKPLNPAEIIRFFTESKGVRAQTAEQVCEVRERLYQLEELLDPGLFIRISNSEIVNLHMIRDLELTFNGTYKINLQHSVSTYTSRRYVNHLRRRLEL
ncbi:MULTISPECIES: LytTR family DNA-binding domain-containing protein [unclassified Sporolactobacillus]|uniref:LytTR family DNA-binding domain-containing protein n=1 Tax=unclassified Sporolactobacillus TaxID=2628533 RepID=UPI00236767DC|nr:LytTR family DNA-binding domain-containing protein [Sporolactobacillus sp. CQH2019]MDD9150578.1 LytTR family DNA-binding domain-containing protein [Sporolactobacillus sp. CQH2019]